MKKNTKKLTLHRETLQNLAKMAIGGTGWTRYSGCDGAQCQSGTYPCNLSFCICD